MTIPTPEPNLQLALQASLQAGEAILQVYRTGNFQVELKHDHSPVTLADKKASDIITRILNQSQLPVISEEASIPPYEERKQWQSFWLVDPLDGTREFIKKNGEFTVNIALLRNNHPKIGIIYAPVPDTLYLTSPQTGPHLITQAHKTLHHNILEQATRLPIQKQNRPYRILTSRSHTGTRTQALIDSTKKEHPDLETIPLGSALKLAKIASGEADLYIRFGPTMEWDTAAGHALLNATGAKIIDTNTKRPLTYNKPDLHNPSFIARRQ